MDLALGASEQALWSRTGTQSLVNHSDRGCQYLSIRYTERLAEAGIGSSVGSVGDSYDNAMAESMVRKKVEVIRQHLEPIGNVPPAETEPTYYAQTEELVIAA